MTKTLTTSLLLIMLSLSVFGQNKVRIGISFSPDYNFRSIKEDGQKVLNDVKDSAQVALLGYTSGFNTVINLGSRLSLETGVHYAKKGYEVQTDYKYNVQGQNDPLIPSKSDLQQVMQYIDVPVKANLHIINFPFKLFISAGVSSNILLAVQGKENITFRNGRTETNTDKSQYANFNPLNFAAVGGIGAEFNLFSKLFLRLEPVYRQSLTSINKTGDAKAFLNSIGVNGGLFIGL